MTKNALFMNKQSHLGAIFIFLDNSTIDCSHTFDRLSTYWDCHFKIIERIYSTFSCLINCEYFSGD